MTKHLTIYTDGGSRGNPGPAAIGAVIRDGETVVKTISRTIGETTNNQAEYQAVHASLEVAKELGAETIDFFCDSELVVKQIRGEYKMKNKDLGVWYVKIHSLINQFSKVTFTNIPREQNTAADALVNQALDQ